MVQENRVGTAKCFTGAVLLQGKLLALKKEVL
jgi:hypothetical protein